MNYAEVFISYSHEDKEWKNRLVKFLEVMKKAKGFNYQAWHDSKIDIGKKWEDEINAAINNAKVAILLISPDFLQSQFILENEVPRLKERNDNGDLILIPLLIRPCPWELFEWLSPIQGYLQDDTILSGCNEHAIELNLTKLVREINRTLSDLNLASEADEEFEPRAQRLLATSKQDVSESAFPQKEGPLRDDNGLLTEAGVTYLINESQRIEPTETIEGLINIFRTKRQKTWLIATSSKLFCVLDDEKTAAKGSRIQWSLPLVKAKPVTVKERPSRSTGLVNIGSRQNWLYSQRLHPDPDKLKKNIEKIVDVGYYSGN